MSARASASRPADARAARHAGDPFGVRAPRLVDALWLAPVAAAVGVVGAIGLDGAPVRASDDTVLVAQSWAAVTGAPNDPWFASDAPAWSQIALWAAATSGPERHGDPVLAAREAMIAASVVAVVLLFVLARRLGLARPAAAAAGLVFGLSPLALQLHRTVGPEGVAVPWLLAAALAATAVPARARGAVAAGVCTTVAVLCVPSFAVAAPVIGWLLVRDLPARDRPGRLAVAGSVAVLAASAYLIVGLATALAAGAQPGGGGGQPGDVPWRLDPVGVVVVAVAALLALPAARLRPLAVLVIAVPLLGLAAGGVSARGAELVAPFGAVVAAGATEAAILLLLRSTRRARLRTRPALLRGRALDGRPALVRRTALAWAVGAGAAVAVAVPAWAGPLTDMMRGDLDGPQRRAVDWIDAYATRSDVVLADPAVWLDLSSRDRVPAYPTSGAIAGEEPDWSEVDWVVVSSTEPRPAASVRASLALDASVPAAVFTDGASRVEVRAVVVDGVDAAARSIAAAAAERARLGPQVAGNSGLLLDPAERALLAGGVVDDRVALALASTASVAVVEVGGFPAVDGEDMRPRRQVLVAGIDGDPAVDDDRPSARADQLVDALTGDYRPVGVTATDDGLLLTWTPDPLS